MCLLNYAIGITIHFDSTIVESNVSNERMIEMLTVFGQNYGQELLIPEVLKF